MRNYKNKMKFAAALAFFGMLSVQCNKTDFMPEGVERQKALKDSQDLIALNLLNKININNPITVSHIYQVCAKLGIKVSNVKEALRYLRARLVLKGPDLDVLNVIQVLDSTDWDGNLLFKPSLEDQENDIVSYVYFMYVYPKIAQFRDFGDEDLEVTLNKILSDKSTKVSLLSNPIFSEILLSFARNKGDYTTKSPFKLLDSFFRDEKTKFLEYMRLYRVVASPIIPDSGK